MQIEQQWDVLVIGSGIAGLRAALSLAEERRVLIVTKKEISESNTNYAQGGIASVLASEDSFESHIADTAEAGAGICRPEILRKVVEAGPRLIEDLVQQGIHFTHQTGGGYQLGREGGHSHRRIVHVGDFTGREIEAGLVARVRAHPSISLAVKHFAVDFLRDAQGRVVGATVFDRVRRRLRVLGASTVILAAGGCGKVYRYASNPDIATGDGLAMAWRAGATLANLEFVQFHPTSLFHPRARNFLISEAVRGEGALLRNLDGEAFMHRYDPRADLAPRDIVARAIDHETKRRGETHVILDTTIFEEDYFRQRFPNIHGKCRQLGLEPLRNGLPVVPAAHYMCGGVLVDEQGRTELENLFVIGESACTGLHGANRLASNSLLEALYFAHVASEAVLSGDPTPVPATASAPVWPESPEAVDPTALKHDWELARKTMWDYVGIQRRFDHLRIAHRRLGEIAASADQWVRDRRPDVELFELRNLSRLGQLITESALFRRESRGLHSVADYPDADPDFLGETCLRSDRPKPWLRPLDRAETSASPGEGEARDG